VPKQCKQANPVRLGTKFGGFCYKILALGYKIWRVRFTIVAFICSLLQYFRAVVCFALQPFTISGEDK
jgi:hypothetical protein